MKLEIKNFFKGKAFGFYVSVFVFVFSIVAAIVYSVGYIGNSDFTASILWVIGAGILASVILVAFKRYNWVPVAFALSNFVAFLLFVKSIYFYVSVVMYGINGSAFSPAFIRSTVFFVLALGFSVANIFIKQINE